MMRWLPFLVFESFLAGSLMALNSLSFSNDGSQQASQSRNVEPRRERISQSKVMDTACPWYMYFTHPARHNHQFPSSFSRGFPTYF